MNRELKFRLWYYDQEKFDYNVGFEDFKKYSFPLYWCSVQQYTGVKDKNGKEIYEGDIIAFGSTEQEDLFKVVWDDDDVRFVLYSYGGKGCWFTDVKDREVIGNIFENSELLKQ